MFASLSQVKISVTRLGGASNESIVRKNAVSFGTALTDDQIHMGVAGGSLGGAETPGTVQPNTIPIIARIELQRV